MAAVVVDRDEGKGKGRRCLISSGLMRGAEEAVEEVLGILEDLAETILVEMREELGL